jgi:starvation-inducible outer membrane lipoprotein
MNRYALALCLLSLSMLLSACATASNAFERSKPYWHAVTRCAELIAEAHRNASDAGVPAAPADAGVQ